MKMSDFEKCWSSSRYYKVTKGQPTPALLPRGVLQHSKKTAIMTHIKSRQVAINRTLEQKLIDLNRPIACLRTFSFTKQLSGPNISPISKSSRFQRCRINYTASLTGFLSSFISNYGLHYARHKPIMYYIL